ncbi:S1-like domain-containing RNA-binding protein [Clostridium sp. OS1-26]|uniref:CvfB family protein n=1 Tax=Clostridium sp. OS1-26 TaxID=3070681 RepID=UPI0027DFBD8D|nr:S1-like domain-containing RNA-binding protein [Clostridium sp. OS1-26]WML36703.1 S1-like domain-containing RNA-binding protein [Clostridium sp. OS1-26]
MINIGDFNKLKVVRKADFGYYLDAGTGRTSDDILLPNKSALGNELNIDDEVEAFVYRDSKDRLIATLKKPLATVGELAYLKVVSTTKIGSFVAFGLERDILVPFKEKLYGLLDNKSYLFYIYLDKTGRIAATTDIDRYLEDTDKYSIGDSVTGTVYGFQTNQSVMVAVDNMYKGVILKNEYYRDIKHGDVLDLTIIKIYEDGKLGLTPRKAGKIQRTELQDTILEYLKEHGGFMPFNDKSSPEEISDTFHVSKNNFKNSLGGLMKRNLIVQDEKGTKLK